MSFLPLPFSAKPISYDTDVIMLIASHFSTQAILAGATVNMETLPDKLNPVVKPLMESIKREECQIIQQLSAKYLVKLLDLVRIRNPSPNNKIITNLCTLLKSDAEFTPKIVSETFFNIITRRPVIWLHFRYRRTSQSNHSIRTTAKVRKVTLITEF